MVLRILSPLLQYGIHLLSYSDDTTGNRRNRLREIERMVAIWLYRGNLQRVPPDLPRRWLTPKPQISLNAFRSILLRRSEAIFTLPSTSSAAYISLVSEKPNSLPEPKIKVEDAANCDVNPSPPLDQIASLIDAATTQREDVKTAVVGSPPQGNKILYSVDVEKEKRKKEVEEKLHILNEKKHDFVKALKEILSAEEELKRRGSTQGGRPPLPLQADASNDSASMTRHATPRTGSDANVTIIIWRV